MCPWSKINSFSFHPPPKHPPLYQKTHIHTRQLCSIWTVSLWLTWKQDNFNHTSPSTQKTCSFYTLPTQLCERVIRRNDAQSHHIPSLSSHIKNLPSQLHSSPNSHGHPSNPLLLIWTAGPFKVSPSWQGKCLFFKLGERREVFLSIHITGVDSTWSALLFCGSKLCQVSTYSKFGFLVWCFFFNLKASG